ncbi:acyl-homoserine-lactone synthase [Dongia sedimenti]|uniref:Acyl-homoserine-lactone synthase n=1 Tax=Dongia sedimenti TaxID=3064282 RepID=A0ABU0YV73_9PROT|nr:acyl-homoserine-lactone synthase [Rhodospirillaceae bacterium R-7]
MMQLIGPEWHGAFAAERAEMHRLRYRVFKERLDWGVQVADGAETDVFDSAEPVYLLQRGRSGDIQGCVRLLPTTGPNMLRDVFPKLLAGRPAPAGEEIWESSRFALDLPPAAAERAAGLAAATYELFAGMIEFGLSRSLIDIVTVTDIRIERILRRAGWPLRRIAEPYTLGNTKAVAGYLEVSLEALRSVRQAGGIGRPVLWAPVLPAAYAAALEEAGLVRPDGLALPDAGSSGAAT